MPKPNKINASYYNQDDLTYYSKNGGSVVDLFYEVVGCGNFVVIEQKPFNEAATILTVLKTREDVDDRKRSRRAMEDWLYKILNPEPPAQS